MARGKAKGKDAASMSGKCTMGAGGVTMLLGLIATIMAGVSIKLTFNTEKLNKCRDKVYPSGCSRRALSEVSAGAHTNSINSKWSAEFLSAVGVKAPENRKLFAWDVGFNTNAVSSGAGCGGLYGNDICAVKTDGDMSSKAKNSVTCKDTKTCSGSYNTCKSPGLPAGDNCYGTVRAKDDRDHNGYDKTCCAGVCGTSNDLKEADCSAKDGAYTEICQCKVSKLSDDGDGMCDTATTSTFQETEHKTTAGVKIGVTKCKWTSGSSASAGGDCTFTKDDLCQGMDNPTVTQAIGNISMMGVIAGLVATAGVIPAIVGAVAKLKGNEQLETMCGMIGAFTTLCCGFLISGAISAYLMFVGGFLSALCTTAEGNIAEYSSVTSECNTECRDALISTVDSYCGLGRGLSSTSIVCFLACFCGLITAIYSCIGFCNRKKQQQQIVIIQQGGPPVANAQVVPVEGDAKPPEV
jgi:hypothetical protein